MPKLIRKTSPRPVEQSEAVEETTPPHTKSAEELKAATDALLDDIEDVLEENAEQFVADYIQKGGE